MASLNKVLLMGNLTRDPELRYTPSGTAVADLSLAINRKYNTASGEKKEETCFVDVTLWARRAEVACQYLKKGSPVFVEGRLQLDQWETDGQKRSKLKVVAQSFEFIGGGGGSGRSTGADEAPEPEAPEPEAPEPESDIQIDEDNIPF